MTFACAATSGCYYGHLASGQIGLLWAREPIEEVLDDESLSEEVRDLLGLVDDVRSFGAGLGLAVDGQYTSFVDWPGDRVVTTLVRTHPGSVEAVPFWFPILGHLPYKGYFDRERAEREAERLREDGPFDVCVSGVAAYSTLGWIDDPVTSPMLRRGPATLVETLLHELVHATAFIADDVDFNESVAQFIGQEAAVRFFRELEVEGEDGGKSEGTSSWPSAERVSNAIADRRLIAERMIAFRESLSRMEGEPDLAEKRARAEEEERRAMSLLPLRELDPERVARAARLSNACLALRGTYIRDLPRHARVLAALDGDLAAMVERLALWADEDRDPEAFYAIGSPEVVLEAQPGSADRASSVAPVEARGDAVSD